MKTIALILLASIGPLWPNGPLPAIANRHHLDRPCWLCVNSRDDGWSDPDITWSDHCRWDRNCGCSACLSRNKK